MCVIARRALPDVAISSKPTIDNVDSVLPLRRFFTPFRMTTHGIIEAPQMRHYHKKLRCTKDDVV